jgi:Methyltransferase domain
MHSPLRAAYLTDLRYLRFRTFLRLKRPFADWARRRRMRDLVRHAGLRQGMSVLDLGGKPDIWAYDFIPSLKITILNLPGQVERSGTSQHTFRYVEGNACHVDGMSDFSFDLVFSNSVIEHVGGPDCQAAFAHEVRRMGRAHWVQTPSIWFPIEAHSGMPLWWFYPPAVRRSLIARWRKKLPAWTEMIEGTTVLRKSDLRRLFPDARIIVERVCGIPKSYVAFRLAVMAEQLVA